jgi:hypothetical protein
MPASVIIDIEVLVPAVFREDQRQAGPLFDRYGGKFLAAEYVALKPLRERATHTRVILAAGDRGTDHCGELTARLKAGTPPIVQRDLQIRVLLRL